ncbi:alanine dehydrogenase [Halarcobacter anaerophilus]|uniref:Alanine dehydrogenase n=1 Tax=Halarcobacter anaerophilus TaxID=877500 RepID=A0A4V1LQ08_9BACT|nr:alanine dehydrogenase [Halarcobacter anaerophilus]QDF29998.1 alanine dehydrogenase [Halarcobacter anaerophilus]RXJ63048.1 alanine dehydrogenase [Halarcobacter anaerophilus]
MKIGLVKEIKVHEYRVGLTPSCVEAYVENGHTVFVEKDAGTGAGFENSEYEKAGATIVEDKKKIFDESEMIVKVKEPLPQEYEYFHEGQILYTYLHIAADRPQAEMLLNKKIKAVAYETITNNQGGLPCLTPMSEIAGRLAVQEGAKFLEKPFGGRGVLLGGVPGVQRGNVVIVGGGIVGLNACKMAVGLGANVTVLDISASRLAFYDDLFGSQVTTLFSNKTNLIKSIKEADLVIGAVLIPGATTPKLIKKEDLKLMKKNSVLVDVAIDQGGCFETSKATYHDNPTYIVNDVVHYCVANMPGAVSLTSTLALTATTLNHGLAIANKGLEKALHDDIHLSNGLNTYEGKLTNKAVAESLKIPYEAIKF